MDYNAMLQQLLGSIINPQQAPQSMGPSGPGYNESMLLNAMNAKPQEDPIQKRLTGWKGFLQKMKEQPEMLEALNAFGGSLAQSGDWRANAGQGLMLFQQTLSEAKKKKLLAEQAAQKDKLDKTQLLLQARGIDRQEARDSRNESNQMLDRTFRLLEMGSNLERQGKADKMAEERLGLEKKASARADKAAGEDSKLRELQRQRLEAELSKPEGEMPMGQGYSQMENLAASIFNAELKANPKITPEERKALYAKSVDLVAAGLTPATLKILGDKSKNLNPEEYKQFWKLYPEMRKDALNSDLSDSELATKALNAVKAGSVAVNEAFEAGAGSGNVSVPPPTSAGVPTGALAEAVAQIKAAEGTVISTNNATGELVYRLKDGTRTLKTIVK